MPNATHGGNATHVAASLPLLSNDAWLGVYEGCSAIDFIIAVYALTHFGRLVYWRKQGGKDTSIRIGFHLLLAVNLLLRIVGNQMDTYILYHSGHTLQALDIILDSLPTFVFMSTYLLVLTQWAQVNVEAMEKSRRTPFDIKLYFKVNAVVYFFLIGGYATLAITANASQPVLHDARVAWGCVSSFINLCAGVAFVWLGGRINRAMAELPGNSASRARVVKRISLITWSCAVLFLLRAIDVMFPLVIFPALNIGRYTGPAMCRYLIDQTLLEAVPGALMMVVMRSTRATHFRRVPDPQAAQRDTDPLLNKATATPPSLDFGVTRPQDVPATRTSSLKTPNLYSLNTP